MVGDKYVVEQVESGWTARRYNDGPEKYAPGQTVGWSGVSAEYAIRDIRRQELTLLKHPIRPAGHLCGLSKFACQIMHKTK